MLRNRIAPLMLIVIWPVAGFSSERQKIETTELIVREASARVAAALKDPESARFSDWKAYRNSNGTVDVCGKVNAKNSFGGYSGAAWFVVPESLDVQIYNNSARGFTASNAIVETLCELK